MDLFLFDLPWAAVPFFVLHSMEALNLMFYCWNPSCSIIPSYYLNNLIQYTILLPLHSDFLIFPLEYAWFLLLNHVSWLIIFFIFIKWVRSFFLWSFDWVGLWIKEPRRSWYDVSLGVGHVDTPVGHCNRSHGAIFGRDGGGGRFTVTWKLFIE